MQDRALRKSHKPVGKECLSPFCTQEPSDNDLFVILRNLITGLQPGKVQATDS